MKFLKDWRVLLIIVVIIALVIYLIYRYGKNAGKTIPLPHGGNGIPSGWTATEDVVQLYEAESGLGTNESAIWNVLEGKTDDQLVAIYNEFQHKYNTNLFDWFTDDLSDEDLRRALNYFKGLV